MSTVIISLDPLNHKCGGSERQVSLVFRNVKCWVNHNNSCHPLNTTLYCTMYHLFNLHRLFDFFMESENFAQEKVNSRMELQLSPSPSSAPTPTTIQQKHQKGRKILLTFPLPIPLTQKILNIWGPRNGNNH